MMMSENSVQILARAVGYPEVPAADGNDAEFYVDEHCIRVREDFDGARLVFRYVLPVCDLCRLAYLAVGRILTDEVTLAYDPGTDHVYLWQSVGLGGKDGELRASFAQFVTSCDWWCAAAGYPKGRAHGSLNRGIIRP